MRLEIHPAATLEYQESISWYEQKLAGLGERFEAAVKARLTMLLANPALGTQRWQTYREVIVDKTFPFLIVFKYYPAEDVLYISAIFHTSRNPRGKYRTRD